MKKEIVVLFLSLILVSFSYAQNRIPILTEKEKIESLIIAIETLDSARFYRNGSFYHAKEAANHLRMKVDKAGDRVKTAQDFIEKVASKSYFIGDDYKIVYNNGKEVTSNSFLTAKLKQLNSLK